MSFFSSARRLLSRPYSPAASGQCPGRGTAAADYAATNPPVEAPFVDILITNLHADCRGTARAERRLPLEVLLAHMLAVVARRQICLRSVNAAALSITLVLEDGDLKRRHGGFRAVVDELLNGVAVEWDDEDDEEETQGGHDDEDDEAPREVKKAMRPEKEEGLPVVKADA